MYATVCGSDKSPRAGFKRLPRLPAARTPESKYQVIQIYSRRFK